MPDLFHKERYFMIVKTNFFQRTFNITVVLLTYGLFFFLLSLCFRFTQDLLGNAQSTYLSELFATISSWLSQGEYYTKIITILMSLIAVLLITIVTESFLTSTTHVDVALLNFLKIGLNLVTVEELSIENAS